MDLLIDVHMHIGRLYFSDPEGLPPDTVLRFMDEHGIEIACLLPMENPEHTDFYITSDYVLEVAREHPDRFLPFCNVDPRRRDVRNMIRHYRDEGCLGYGETISTLAMDDPLMEVVYEACGEAGMPIIFDLMHGCGNHDARSCFDEPGLPRYERMLQAHPETVFIGHGPHFWANIAEGFDPYTEKSYPEGPVREDGPVVRLLKTYPNAYADISAGSGHNALTRDPEFGCRFLEECRDSLLFGTDLCRSGQTVPNTGTFRNAFAGGKISREAYEKIGWRNARELLGI
ncbi:MAG: amidohydrolase family protein [Lentisphaerae bacterium]|jgi:uncharacterized protein|nr:amidohydrolase family protein [Lentisphaerota bacterium]MBT4822585.1 amidohydrolase family protein [Lentisphaerota bacterium]MBT5610596.1 amidohydrolase family protein [Lentisphaerota bacterium]MBT7059870.1 amidohydrolase family protein [Lentisphaerota bacterium]MBT7842497.1 amidohydrolase family protein [Lentisphaerota bacterium]